MTVASTSINAYRTEVLPSLGERQKCVYEELTKAHDLTNSELASRLNWPINTITPRVHELRKEGLVIEETKRKCRVTGRTVSAWSVKRNTLF